MARRCASTRVIRGGGPDVEVQLHGDAADRATELGATITVSMTHLASLAGAVALARAAG